MTEMKNRISLILAGAVILSSGLSLTGCSSEVAESSGAEYTRTAIAGKYDENNNCYVSSYDGDAVKIPYEADSAFMTPDGNHVIVKTMYDTLHVGEKNIAEDAKQVGKCTGIIEGTITDEGFLYEDNMNMFRYSFVTDSSLYLGNVAVRPSFDGKNFLVADDTGNISIIKPEYEERKDIGSYLNCAVQVIGVSNDGKMAAWCEKYYGEHYIFVYDNGEEINLKCCETTAEYTDAEIYFTKDSSMLVMTIPSEKVVIIKETGKDPVEVKIPGELSYYPVFTDKGYIDDTNIYDISSIYVSVISNNKLNVYSISLDGNREKIISKLNGYIIFDDRIEYVKDDGAYWGKLEDNQIKDETLIAEEANMCDFVYKTDYVYFMQDCTDEGATCTGTIMCYKIGDKKPVQAVTDASYFRPYNNSYNNNTLSVDGRYLYYFKDPEEIDIKLNSCDLYVWDSQTGKSEKISSEVLDTTLSSNLDTNYINPDNFFFEKFIDEYENDDGEEMICSDLIQIKNGKPQKIISDIVGRKLDYQR